MSLSLFVETSSKKFNFIIAEGNEILFNSIQEEHYGKRKEIVEVVSSGLASINRTYKDIEIIAVNTGPGPTNSIRSGVSFANSPGL